MKQADLPILNMKYENPGHIVNTTITCTFAFSAYFDEDLECWFPPIEGNGNAKHHDPSHVEPHLIRLRTDAVLDKDERRLARDAQSSRISSDTA